MTTLRCEHVVLRVNGRQTVTAVGIEIGPGETVGLVGDRRSVSGVLRALTCRNGGTPKGKRVRWGIERGVSYVPPGSLIPEQITGAEWLRYRAALSGASPLMRVKKTRTAADLSGLGDRLEQRVGVWPESDVAALAVAVEITLASGAVVIDCSLDSCSDDVLHRFARAFWARNDLAVVVAGSDRVIGQIAERTVMVENGTIRCDQPTTFFLKQRVVELEVAVRALNDLAELFRDVRGVQRGTRGLTVPLAVGRTAQQVLMMCRDHGIPVLASHVRSARFHRV